MAAKRTLAVLLRLGGIAGLALASLLYLQFAVQALFAAPVQGILVLIATAALATGAVRFIRHQDLALVVFAGTLPLFVFSLATIFIYADESPVFAVIFGVAPALSGSAWMLRRNTLRRSQSLS